MVLVKSKPRTRQTDVSQPLSCLYLASALRRDGHEILGVLNAQLSEFNLEDFARFLQEKQPKLVGISAITAEATYAHALASAVKRFCPDAVVVMGGHYASNDPERALADPLVDYAVAGEGEGSVAKLADLVDGKASPGEVPGLIYRENGTLKKNAPLPLLMELDQLPLPAWELIDFEAYRLYSPPGAATCSKKRYAVIFTSRGCPYQCRYCHDLHGKRFRARSPANVIEELKLLYHRYGVREFHVMDDIFNFDLERAKCILEEVLRQGISAPLYFGNGLRPERIDEEFLRLLKRVGTEWISFGIDSGVPRIQKLVRRNLDLQKTAETIRLCRKLGFFTKGNFIIGFPTETEEEIKKTIQYMIDSDLDAVYLSYLTPIPGSQIGREHKEELSKEEVMYDGHTYMLITKNYSAVDERRLEALRNEALWKFYFSKKRLLRSPLKHYPGRYFHFSYYFPVLLGKRKEFSLAQRVSSR